MSLQYPHHLQSQQLYCSDYCHNEPEVSKFPTIDELLNDCFLFSINELEDSAKVELVKNFKTFIKSLHCIENLNFLISIYNYEFIFNKLFHEKPVLNNRKNSIHSLNTLNSFKSVENFPTNYFASTIDDITSFDPPNSNYWDDWRDKQLSLEMDLDSDVVSKASDLSKASSSPNSDENTFQDPQVLVNYLQFIIASFILPDSKYQINLSNSVSRSILDVVDAFHANQHLPNPSVFLKAKLEILQLLNDNVYYPFIKKTRECEKLPCESCDCGLGKSPESATSQNSIRYKEPRPPAPSVLPASAPPGPIHPATDSSNGSHDSNSSKKFFPGSLKFKKSRPSSPVSVSSMGSRPKSPVSPALSPSPSNHTSFGSPIFKKASNLNSISSILTHLKLSNKSQPNSGVNSGTHTPNSNPSGSSFNSHRNSLEERKK